MLLSQLTVARSPSSRKRAVSLTSVLFFVLCLADSICPAAQADPDLTAIADLAAHQQLNLAAEKILPYREQHPDSVTAAVLQSEILLRLGLLADADAVLERILLIHPRSIEALSAKAELSLTLGDKSTAEKLFLRCTESTPHSVETWKRLGDFYLSQRRREALSSFRHAETLAHNDPQAIAGEASALHQQSQDAEAEIAFRRAIHLNDNAARPDAAVYSLFAQFLQDQGRYAQSVSEYTRILRLSPQSASAHLGRAMSLVRLSAWKAAEADLQISLKDDQSAIPSLNLLAKVLQAEGKSEEAQGYAARAEKLSSDLAAEKATNNGIASALQSARGLMQNNRVTEATKAYQSLLRAHPEVAEAWFDLGRCHSLTEEFDEAESDVRRYLSLESNSASGHLLLGRILLMKKRPADARGEFAVAQRLDPSLDEARMGAAASYMIESDFSEAIRRLNELTSLPAVKTEAQLMLTEALFKSDQAPAALREVAKVLRENPSNLAAQRMRDAIERNSKTDRTTIQALPRPQR